MIERIGPYEIRRVLGQGGMGIVYLAHDPVLDREVALKLPLRDAQGALPEKALARFAREAKAVARLQHPRIVSVLAAGEHQGLPFLAMQYVPGRNLEQRVREEGALIAGEAVTIVARIARAVQHAHEHQILHRDLKPENVLQDEHGEVFLTDFGLTKIVDATGSSGLTAPGAAVGTLNYLPPEQLDRGSLAATQLSDVYGLGATLYTLLVGKPAVELHEARDIVLGILRQRWEWPSTRRAGVPSELDAICATAMALEPDDRYPSALALAEDLERQLRGEPLQARPLPARSNPARALAAALAADLEDHASQPEPAAPATYVGRAKQLLTAGQLPEALGQIEARLASAPGDLEARLLRGVILRQLGRVVEAIRTYDGVLADDPREVRALVSRGVARMALKDFVGASEDLRQALERIPTTSRRRVKVEKQLDRATRRLGSSELRGFRLPDDLQP